MAKTELKKKLYFKVNGHNVKILQLHTSSVVILSKYFVFDIKGR
jgi:hypothetical protein